MTEMECVYCAVLIESSYITQANIGDQMFYYYHHYYY